MDKIVDEWEWIPILPGDGIRGSVVLDEVGLSVFLLDEEDQGSCKGNLTNLRRELHLSLAKGNPK
jgi:hypothetical protein